MDALDVVVAGAVGIDTNVYLHGEDIDFTVEANFSSNLDSVGQAGGYSSKGFAALGCRTALVASLGRDPLGAWVREDLAAAGVETLFFEDREGTHRSVNFMYRDGRRKNFYDGRGQMDVRPDLAAVERLLAGARLVHVHLENWCRELLAPARRHKLVVSCDLQDIVRLDDPYRGDFIEAADVLFFSTVNFPDPRPVVEGWLSARPGRIVVGGMGAAGAVLGSAEGVRFFPAVTGEAPVVDTNGAGDALAAGFLTSWLFGGFPLEAALWRGQIAARHVCEQRAAGKRMITVRELDQKAASKV